MTKRLLLLLTLWAAAGSAGPAASAGDPASWFAEAVRSDVTGTGSAAQAFALYRRAAEAGLPEAQFNVAVMLDSGRGTTSNVVQAATWYARAAAHGNQRAAYNLGQLYALGEGVPRNTDLARAWFLTSHLDAAREHIGALKAEATRTGRSSAPRPVFPTRGVTVDAGIGGVELVWTSEQQPGSSQYFVELTEVGESTSHEVFSGFAKTSSLFVKAAGHPGRYAWRVFRIGVSDGTYEGSSWVTFEAEP